MPVDPAVAEGFVEGLGEGEGGRVRGGLFGEGEPDTWGGGGVVGQPVGPGGAVLQNDGGEICCGWGHGRTGGAVGLGLTSELI